MQREILSLRVNMRQDGNKQEEPTIRLQCTEGGKKGD